MKPCLILFCTLVIASGAFSQKSPNYVPNSETAVAIAEAVLIPVYGKKKVESERPYKAKLNGDVWTVTGTLYCPDGKAFLGKTSHL